MCQFIVGHFGVNRQEVNCRSDARSSLKGLLMLTLFCTFPELVNEVLGRKWGQIDKMVGIGKL